jgi:hypothetical protein
LQNNWFGLSQKQTHLQNIKKINELYDKGYYIKLFTSIYMGQLKNNLSAVTEKNDIVTKLQLKKWALNFISCFLLMIKTYFIEKIGIN